MTTTFEAIRDNQCALIEALTPTARADIKLRRHRDGAFMDWVEKNPGACLRRFQILSNFDIEQGPTADGSIESCVHTIDLRIAYPNDMGKYGAENDRDQEDFMLLDLHLIDATIGLNGGTNYVTNQDLCRKQSQSVIEVAGPREGESARVLSVIYLIQYDRSV